MSPVTDMIQNPLKTETSMRTTCDGIAQQEELCLIILKLILWLIAARIRIAQCIKHRILD